MKTTFKEEEKNLVMYFEGRLDTAASAEVEKAWRHFTNALVTTLFWIVLHSSISHLVVCACSLACSR